MRIAALYDIHGNLPALEAVLADAFRESVELVVVGGDVLPGPMPTETLDCLRSMDVRRELIRGNGDRVVLAQHRGQEATEVPEQFRSGIRWNASRLLPVDAWDIESWDETLSLTTDAGAVLFCHATPRSDVEIFTRETPEDRIAPAFANVEESIVICGHTHMQFDRTIGRHRVVNAGSVGMTFGEPGACWLLIDDGLHLRRTTYDLEDAARRIRATAYPDAVQFAERNVLHPPTEEAMLAAFSRA
jgi:putative phosphoesterase